MVRARRWLPAAIAALAIGAAAPVAHAGPHDREVLREWLARMRAELDALAAARAPVRVPPVPVKVVWRPKRLASINLGAPLLALVGGDLDGDHKAELYAVTEREVVAFDAGPRLVERTRTALPAELPAIRPRDAVATAYVERGPHPELRVRASSRARGARYTLDGKALKEVGATASSGGGGDLAGSARGAGAASPRGMDEFPLCPGKTLALVPGRNHFGTVEAPIYNLRCRDDLVDHDGTPLAAVAELGPAGALAVTVTPRAGTAGPASPYAGTPVAVSAVGTAYELADLDRDGTIEVIAAGAGAPGDKDAIKVLAVTGTGVGKKPVFRKAFTGGVVAIAVADVDGDGADEVIGAVRLPGSTKVDLWQLNP